MNLNGTTKAAAVLADGEKLREEMEAVAGHSSHEVRTWVAAYSALAACGDYAVSYEFYRPIKEYIAGFAVTVVVGMALLSLI